MPRAKKRPKPMPTPQPERVAVNGPASEVLTLAEAAAYLRLPEDAVQAAVQDHDLPGRFIGGEWRFLKASIQEWLRRGPRAKSNKEAWRSLAGAWKDDPNLDALLEEIATQRAQWQPEDER